MNTSAKELKEKIHSITETINMLCRDVVFTHDLFITFLKEYSSIDTMDENEREILKHHGDSIIRRIQINSIEVKKTFEEYEYLRKELKEYSKKDILGPFPQKAVDIFNDIDDMINKITTMLSQLD